MAKITDEADEDHSESTSRRLSLDTSPPHTPSPRPSTSSNPNPYNPNPHHPSLPPGSPDSSSSISSAHTFHGFSANPSPLPTPSHPPLPPPTSVNRFVRDAPPAYVARIEAGPVAGFVDGGGGGGTDYESGVDTSVGGEERDKATTPYSFSAPRRAGMVIALRKAAIALRWIEFALCLVSFSVMAADRNRGWALDSFTRYKEFKYSMIVNVIGFAYAGLQGCCLARQLGKGKHITGSLSMCCIVFMMDQMLAYLLMSASSSAATRVDDWIQNWGKDKFPTMAGASVAVSFVAFAAFAVSSMISGYLLCTSRST